MTTGWLLSEAIWKISEDDAWYSELVNSHQGIIALEAKWDNDVFYSTLDFYLTCYDKDLAPLSSKNIL